MSWHGVCIGGRLVVEIRRDTGGVPEPVFSRNWPKHVAARPRRLTTIDSKV
ncbi:MAG: hypothetical protein RBS80_19330 [Thermoguttaceae bacterium]|nr:hypothetical protein [Thermoguttaceae bacterium]